MTERDTVLRSGDKYVVGYFTITFDSCTVGFQEHIILDLSKPIVENIRKRIFRVGQQTSLIRNTNSLIKIIETNASLRLGFGWSFESSTFYENIMYECMEQMKLKHQSQLQDMTSDLRCDWLGFVPFNIFDQIAYKDLSIYDLIKFNNNLVNFQADVIDFLINHKLYKQHAIIRDKKYRFEIFKSFRKDPGSLSEAYEDYIQAIIDVCGITSLTRDYIEEEIGCHFLYHPELFFELLEFSTLKGNIHV